MSAAGDPLSRAPPGPDGAMIPHRRLAPSRPLSISVPPANPFLPSRARDAAGDQWEDVQDGQSDVDSRPDAVQLVSEQAGSDSDQDELDNGSASGSSGPCFSGEDRSLRRRRRNESEQPSRVLAAEIDDAPPTTPVTLPPVSFDCPPAGPYLETVELDETSSPRNSFPSSEEGGIGLGVDSDIISHHANRLFARSIEGMRERALRTAYVNGATGQDSWKEEIDVVRPDETLVAPPLVDLGIGGSSNSTPQIPFPASPILTSSINTGDMASLDRELPPLPDSRSSTPATASASVRSARPSTASTGTTNSSTLSLPTIPQVTLPLPNRTSGTFVSVANGPMAALGAGLTRSPSHRGPRAFFSHLLNRSPRIHSPSPPSSPNPSDTLPRSPSAPLGFSSPVAAAQRQASHHRSSSLPSPDASQSAFSAPRSPSAPSENLSRSPRMNSEPAPMARATPFRSGPSPLINSTSSPFPLSGFLPPTSASSSPNLSTLAPGTPIPAAPPPTLASIGLSLVPLTQPLSLSKHSQPLCGAVLDDKYILIGTSGGLDFLPIPLPGSLPMQSHGKKRRETRKPISLIKRTRFQDLAILSERSNILLAIAGKNLHIRVYALDGIRAMIEKKMAELDIRDGYPIIPDTSILQDTKGKARAHTTSAAPETRSSAASPPSFSESAPPSAPIASSSTSSPFQFPALSPPPDYSLSAPSPRRRFPSSPTASSFGPSSPIRPTARHLSSATNIVRAVPTNPRPTMTRNPSALGPASPRTLRGQKSREFVAHRRSSAAVSAKRRSRADLSDSPAPSGISTRRGSAQSIVEEVPPASAPFQDDEAEDAGDEGESARLLTAPRQIPRRTSSASTGESGWTTDPAVSPVIPQSSRLQARPPGPESRSAARDMADFLRTTEPKDVSASPTRDMRSASVGDISHSDDPRPPLPRSLSSGKSSGFRHSPRQATTSSDHAATLELADFIRSSGPPPARRASVSATSQVRREARSPTSPPLRSSERSPTLELAALMRETGPSAPTNRRWINGGGVDAGASVSPRAPSSSTFDSLPRSVSAPSGGILASANSSRFSNPFSSSNAPLSALSPNSNGKGKGVASDSPRGSLDGRSSGLSPPVDAGLLRRSSSVRGLVARDPTGRKDAQDDSEESSEPGARRESLTLAEAMREGPPLSQLGSGSLPTSASMPSLESSSAPTNRANKRWTMSGIGPKFLRTPDLSASVAPPGSISNSTRRSSTETRRSSLQIERPDSSSRTITPPPPVPSLPPAPISPSASRSTPLPPHDFKRPPSTHATDRPSLPASSQLPPDAHPANSNSPLEYVKLARTKGARLLRAVETKKRTYLAVLCGDEGERIELFTGSRSISLSLNRTFVLPEHPRTIEFQLQGDDLIDIYLVYPESIFALEPATVRVREVGVGRGERRARRDAERRMRQTTSATVEPDAADEPPTATSLLHPADPALSQDAGSPGDESPPEQDTLRPTTPQPMSRPSSRDASPPPPPPPRSPQSYQAPPPPLLRSRSSDGGADTPPSVSSKLPYTTFQQLPFVPPVPSSVLASAWIIPPLYTDVMAGDGEPLDSTVSSVVQPSITVTQEGTGATPPAFRDFPLLSPISLLGGAAQRANGPPGLFFVSKGKNLSGIVTGDGRSVIKKPLVWSLDKMPEGEASAESYRRIEMIIVGGTRTVVVGLGSSEVKAIAVGGEDGQPPFGQAISVTPTMPTTTRAGEVREIEFLGNHAKTNQLFFTERVAGQAWRCWCLGAKQ